MMPCANAISVLAIMVASMPQWVLGAGNVLSTTKEQKTLTWFYFK